MQDRARFEPRHSVGLGGVLSVGNRHFECVTSDVSFSGASVRVDASSLRQVTSRDLATLRLSLQPTARVIEAPASVVHVTPARNVYAVGLRFFAFAGSDRIAWDTFVRGLGTAKPARSSAAGLALLPLGQHFEPLLYRNAFQTAVLRVYVPSVRDLLYLAERQATSMFIVTDEPLRPGNEVGLQFVHPNSEDVFEASAFVVRVVDQHGMRGVEVEFLDLAFDRFDRFREFVEDGIESWLDDTSYAAGS